MDSSVLPRMNNHSFHFINERVFLIGRCGCMQGRFSCIWLFVTLWTVAPRLLCPWASPGKNTRVGCHALFQGIFLILGLNLLCLLPWQAGSLLPVPSGKPTKNLRINPRNGGGFTWTFMHVSMSWTQPSFLSHLNTNLQQFHTPLSESASGNHCSISSCQYKPNTHFHSHF